MKIINTNIDNKIISDKGEGSFSELIKALIIKGEELVAIKWMKQIYSNNGTINSLFEKRKLKRFLHKNIISLLDVIL